MKKRLPALLLAAVLCITAGCAAPTQPLPTAEPASPSVLIASDAAERAPAPELLAGRAYRRQSAMLPKELDSITDLCISGARLYILGETASAENEMPETRLYSIGLDGRDLRLLRTFADQSALLAETGYIYFSGLTAAEGGVWVRESVNRYIFNLPPNFNRRTQSVWDYYEREESSTLLVGVAADGSVTGTIDLPAVGSLTDAIFRGDRLIGIRDTRMMVFDRSGTLLTEATVPEWLYRVTAANGVPTLVAANDSGRSVTYAVDPETGTLGEAAEAVPASLYNVAGSLSGSIVFSDDGDLFAYSPSAHTTEKLVDWMDYDLDSTKVYAVRVSAEGRVAALYREAGGVFRLVVLTPSETAVLPSYTLTLGVPYADELTVQLVLAYNRESDAGRIRLVDYSEYDSLGKSGMTQLLNDIRSGRCPDLIFSAESVYPADRIAAGSLVNLKSYLAADAELQSEGLMDSVLASLEQDGALYILTPSFELQTAVGSAAVVGTQTMTLDLLRTLAAKLPSGGSVSHFYDTRTQILHDHLSRCSSYFTQADGSYQFLSQVFLDGLELAASYPQTADWNGHTLADTAGWTRVREGQQLLLPVTIGDFDTLITDLAAVGSDAVLCGWPGTPGGHAVSVSGTYAMTTACRDPEAGWSFLRRVLLAQTQQDAALTGFPTNRTVFRAEAQKAQSGEGRSSFLLQTDDQLVEIPAALTEEQYWAFRDALEHTTARCRSNPELWAVIDQATAGFFSGERTAAQAAQDAQDAVKNYYLG